VDRAMTDIYVNTDVVGPGAGTVGDPYKSLQTAWENYASHGAAPAPSKAPRKHQESRP